jgi:hypothetical protein
MSQQINLFNPAFEPQRNLLSASRVAAALGALAAALVLLAGMAQMRVAGLQREANAGAARLADAQARLAKATAEFAPKKPDPVLQAQLAEAQVRLAAMRKAEGVVARGGLGNTQGYAEYFRALARQGGQDLWLTAVGIEGAGADLAVRGRALDPALVPGFIGRLGNEPVMRGKTIGSLAIDQGDPAKDAKDAKDADAAKAGTLPPYVEFQFQSAPAAEAKENKR